jgi:prefoldin subunit 5
MKRPLPLLLLCLLLGAPAWAASGVEAMRTQAQAARSQVRTLRERQQALRGELNSLASRIETLKAERQGKLTPGTELDQALRRSQELSGELTSLAQAVASAESDSERAHLALHTTLSEELARVKASWDTATDRQERSRLVSRMRELRTEREAVRAVLPASQVPAPGPTEASDDPEDLLEQADALRDSEDKVKQRLGTLKARIAELREEKDLERRMSDFLGEESMFDEQDRRLRLRLNSGQGLEVDSTPSRSGGSPSFVGAGDTSSPPTVPEHNPSPSTPEPGAAGTARASDHRPLVDPLRAQQLAAGDFDSLGALEAEARRLEGLAQELSSRAQGLESRVRELK